MTNCDSPSRGRPTQSPAAIRRGDPRGEIGNLVIDTRMLQPGDLFIALRGERFDGHDFVTDAFGRGAGGVVVRNGFGADVANGHGAVIEVDDTTMALQRLGHAVRRASGARVVAITGSAGKTTTKDATAEFLSARYRVVRNKGNFNNHIGLPLSLLELRQRPDVAVVELGMNHPGEISTLVAIAEPDVRVWTNVGDAHLGFFGSADAIADAKAEILERAAPDHVLVCNADDRRVMARARALRGPRRHVRASERRPYVREQVEDLGLDGTRARVVTPAGERILTRRLLGRATCRTCWPPRPRRLEFGVPLDAVVAAAGRLSPRIAAAPSTGFAAASRSSTTPTTRARRRCARRSTWSPKKRASHARSPCSARCSSSAITPPRCTRSRGARRQRRAPICWSRSAARRRAASGRRGAISAGMPPSCSHLFRAERAAATDVARAIRSGDLVLVKGSRGIGTDLVADRLEAEFA